MEKNVEDSLKQTLAKGSDLSKRLCLTEGLGEPYWFNRSENPKAYDLLVRAYEVPNINGLPRLSHGVCPNHKPFLGRECNELFECGYNHKQG